MSSVRDFGNMMEVNLLNIKRWGRGCVERGRLTFSDGDAERLAKNFNLACSQVVDALTSVGMELDNEPPRYSNED